MALWYAGGLLKHARALSAIIARARTLQAPGPGYEAPVNLAYSKRNRSAAVRIPVYSRAPRPSGLSPAARPVVQSIPGLRAMLMAGIDGIKHKIDPASRSTKTFSNWCRGAASIPSMPGSLDEALENSARSQVFAGGRRLHQGIHRTLDQLKKKNESDPVRMRPHPYEFHLYYDI